MRLRILQVLFGLGVAAASAVATGQVVVSAHVTKLDPTFMGNVNPSGTLAFKIDADANGCLQSNANHYLLYLPPAFTGGANTTIDNDKALTHTKAILSTVQLAIALGYKVELTVFPIVPGSPTSFCPVYPIRLLNAP